MLLKEISNVCGVSGHEDAVRRLLIDAVKPYSDMIHIDALGNVIAFKKGRKQGHKVMLAAHMDETGLVCSGITGTGYLKFKTVGKVDTRFLISKRVITEKGVPGVIGMKAIHLQKPEERKGTTPADALFIDIGAASEEEAKKSVSLGDYIYFDTHYREAEDGRSFLKAGGSAAGCTIAASLMKETCVYDTYFCFAAQHHVGARGMITAAYQIQPELALVIGGTGCGDVHGISNEQRDIRLGAGAAVAFMDRMFLAPSQAYAPLLQMARERAIPVQVFCNCEQISDAGAVCTSQSGVPTIFAGIPCRYMDTPVSCIDQKDIAAVMELGRMFITKTDALLGPSGKDRGVV